MGSIDSFRQRYGLSGAVLKWIAIITMFVDHTAATVVRRLYRAGGIPAMRLSPEMLSQIYYVMRRLGRIAFPIFCFMLVEGFFHTRDAKKYAGRLFLFALISELPFDYALHYGEKLFTKSNVYFTLLIGLVVLCGISELRGLIAVQLIVMVAGMQLAIILKTDYSYHGVFLIELLYIMRHLPAWQAGCAGADLLYYEGHPTEMAMIPMLLYNGKRGRQIKYLFYLFYPAHLLFLGLVTHHLLPALGY